MVVSDMSTVAWVESPLQLVGAAEWADAAGVRVTIAGRLTAQMSETADELLARGAPFGDLRAVPRDPLAAARRSTATGWSATDSPDSSVSPRRCSGRSGITFLDDGANAIAFADTLLGRRPYARPGVSERGLTTMVAPFALDDRSAVARLAGRVAVLHGLRPRRGARRPASRDLGFGIDVATASSGRGATAPAADARTAASCSGSAQPGRRPHDAATTTSTGSRPRRPRGPSRTCRIAARRPSCSRAVAAIPGVTLRRDRTCPVELVLAGATEPLEILHARRRARRRRCRSCSRAPAATRAGRRGRRASPRRGRRRR